MVADRRQCVGVFGGVQVSSVEEDDEDDEDVEVGSEVESDDGAEPKPLSRGKTGTRTGEGREMERGNGEKGCESCRSADS